LSRDTLSPEFFSKQNLRPFKETQSVENSG
jgi:hypothetical protein